MRNNKLRIVVSILVASIIIIIGCVAIIFMGKSVIDEKDEQIYDLEAELNSARKKVYVARKTIVAGEKLVVGENVMRQDMMLGLEDDYFIDEINDGDMAVVEMRELQPIMKNMVSQVEMSDDTREFQITVASLMSDQREGDFVDVRIVFPTGEDYVILSKKPLHNLNLGGCSFNTYLNEDEILRINSAAIDAYTIGGSLIYTARYVSPTAQEAATPNYVVRPEVIDMINSDVNIIEKAKETLNLKARMALDAKLGILDQEYVQVVADGHNAAITSRGSIVLKEGGNDSNNSDNSEDSSNSEESEENY